MRYALGIEYDGSGYFGWQSQLQSPTVQERVELALSYVANHEVSVVCAGRTDTGVHARCQVVHFDTESERPERSWILGANSRLPGSIRVLWAREVGEEFHARFSAFERSYRYTICNRWIRPAIGRRQMTWCRKPLDAQRMHEAVQSLLGEHDFSAFRSSGCKARHAVREITRIAVNREGDRVYLDISANGFLYHMVRNIAGSLMDIGSGEQPVRWLGQLLGQGDRTRAGITAAPDGLCFMEVRYPENFGLPGEPMAFPELRENL